MVTHFNPEGVALAISLLTQLKTLPSRAVDDMAFWQFESPLPAAPSIASKSSPGLPSSYDALLAFHQKLKKIKEILGPLVDSIDVVMDDAFNRSRETFFNEGVRRLPDEILATVFSWASETDLQHPNGEPYFLPSYTSAYKIMKLSHVCQRFRSIISSNPSFFATLDVRVPYTLLSASIDKARTVPFTVYIVGGKRGELNGKSADNHKILSLIYQHNLRWRDVFIHIEDWNGPVREMLNIAPKLELPVLRHLRLSGHKPPVTTRHNDSNSSVVPALPMANFISKWDGPSSAYIEQMDTSPLKIPLPLLNATFMQVDLREPKWLVLLMQEFAQLRRASSLTIRCKTSQKLGYPEWPQSFISSCLSSRKGYLANLKNLSIEVLTVDGSAPVYTPVFGFGTTTDFQLYLEDDFFPYLVQVVPGRQMSSLHFACEDLRTFEVLLTKIGIWEGLETLVLEFRRNSDECVCDDELSMITWARVLPNLQSVTFQLDLPYTDAWLTSTGQFVFEGLKKLRQIAFKFCNRDSNPIWPTARVIAETWAKSPGTSPHKELMIWKCGEFDDLSYKHIRCNTSIKVIWC